MLLRARRLTPEFEGWINRALETSALLLSHLISFVTLVQSLHSVWRAPVASLAQLGFEDEVLTTIF